MSSNSKKKNYLVREEIYVPTEEQSLVLGLMGYSAYKLWNVANYERRNWRELGLEEYPDWYDQKKRLKTNFFYKNLPSQSAQRTLKKLDESWESYYSLKKSGGVESPNPPRFKQDKMYVVFVQNAIQVHGDGTFRFTIPKQLKAHLREKHNLEVKFLYLKIGRLSGLRGIKEVQVSFREDGKLKLSIVYEVDLPKEKPDNGRYLAIDLGIKNNFTCFLVGSRKRIGLTRRSRGCSPSRRGNRRRRACSTLNHRRRYSSSMNVDATCKKTFFINQRVSLLTIALRTTCTRSSWATGRRSVKTQMAHRKTGGGRETRNSTPSRSRSSSKF